MYINIIVISVCKRVIKKYKSLHGVIQRYKNTHLAKTILTRIRLQHIHKQVYYFVNCKNSRD